MKYGTGREALLDAAIRIVGEKGLQGLTHRAVAARAGVNHTLIAHHFGSMDGLVTAAMELAVDRSIRETGLAHVADLDEGYADSLLASLASDPEVQMFQAQMVLEARRRPEIRVLVERLYASYISTIDQALRDHGLDAGGVQGQLPRIIFSALTGLVLQYLSVGDSDQVRRAITEIGEFLRALPEITEAGGEPQASNSIESVGLAAFTSKGFL